MVVKKTKGRKVTKKTSKKGKGLLDTAKALWYGRDKLPPNVRKIMEKHGNDEIDYIQVARNPLASSTKLALDVASLGTFSRDAKKLMKEKSYDSLFHLYMVITLKNGKNILTEKNAQINMEYKGVRRDATSKLVSVNKKLTLNTLMAKTKKRMGAKFLPYDGFKNNCQSYIISILKANNLGNETIYKFVKQDTSGIFKTSPIFAKVTRLVTDLGAKLDILKQGAGQKGKGTCWDKDGTFDRDICWGSARGGMSRHCYSKKRSRTKHCMKPENKNSKYCKCHFGENSKNLNPRDQYIGTPAYRTYGKGVKKKTLTKKQKEMMKKHSAQHTKKHMAMMTKLMKAGKTFTQAHKEAMKKTGAGWGKKRDTEKALEMLKLLGKL